MMMMISQEEILLLEAGLKSKKFRQGRASNSNIIVVGMPTGQLNNLSIESFTDSAESQRYDPYNKDSMIKIKVYKRDVQFDDIVFKPITFYFDPSRYFSPLDSYADITPSDSFNDMVEKLKFIKYNAQGREIEEGELRPDVVASEEFSVLPNAKIRGKAITNMVHSDILKSYIKLVTGIDLNEQAFSLNPRGHLFFTSDVATLSSGVTNLFLAQEEIDTEEGFLAEQARIKQLEHFSKSTLFAGAGLRQEAMSPVLFERVYCLPVDPDDFVIDVKKTWSTTSGREAFRTALGAKKIRRTRSGRVNRRSSGNNKVSYKYKMKPQRKNEGSVSIFEYFVSVEIMKAKLSSRSTAAAEKMVAETEPIESYSYEPED